MIRELLIERLKDERLKTAVGLSMLEKKRRRRLTQNEILQQFVNYYIYQKLWTFKKLHEFVQSQLKVYSTYEALLLQLLPYAKNGSFKKKKFERSKNFIRRRLRTRSENFPCKTVYWIDQWKKILASQGFSSVLEADAFLDRNGINGCRKKALTFCCSHATWARLVRLAKACKK